MWPGLAPPYLDLFAWLEGRAEKPVNLDPAPFRPVMLAHAIEDARFCRSRRRRFHRGMEMGRHPRAGGERPRRPTATSSARLYSRTGEDITKSFPDLLPSLHLPGAIDGELLVLRDGRVQTFNVLQQRLNRKIVSPKLMKDYPIHLRAYDLLGDGDNDLRDAAVRRTPRAAGSLRRKTRRSADRPVADDCLRQLGRADRGARRSGQRRRRRRCRGGRGRDAEAPRCALSAGPARRANGGSGSAIRTSSMPC